MKKVWKVAVVGCGMFGTGVYIPNISKEAHCELVAVCDIIPERTQEVAKRFNVPAWYTSVHEMIKKCDFDIAIDAASIQAHHEINMAVLNAGKHLISQKPAAPTVEAFDMQIAKAKEMGVKFNCAPIHPMRFDIAVAKQLMASGAIGEPAYLKCNLAHGGPEYFQYRNADPSWFFEDGAGALVDMGVHGLQIATTVFGPVESISCLGFITDPERKVRSGAYNGKFMKTDKIPDEYFITIRFKNGKAGFIDTGFSQKASKTPQLEIYGTRGTISFTKPYMSNPMPEVYIDSDAVGMRGWITPDPWETVPEKLNSQCCCLKDLVNAIENDCEPVLSPAHAKHILEIMIKIPEAIKTGATVKMDTTF
jgi:predicted dehydrogenase